MLGKKCVVSAVLMGPDHCMDKHCDRTHFSTPLSTGEASERKPPSEAGEAGRSGERLQESGECNSDVVRVMEVEE